MPQVVARYDYVDERGVLLFQVERLLGANGEKGFRQRRPDPEREGQWLYSLEGVRRVPYRLPEIIAARERNEWIVLCEGEKDADSVTAIGQTATTLPGGAGKWRPEYAQYFQDARLTIMADADGPGRKHAATVAKALVS